MALTMRLLWPTLAALLAVSDTGCTAMGLDDLNRSCEPIPLGVELSADTDPCAALNDLHDLRVAEDCRVYQCPASGNGCELYLLDRDGDGAANADRCATETEVASLDCDDRASRVHPGREEECDGLDNDCDGLVDEDFEWKLVEPSSFTEMAVQPSLQHTELKGGGALCLATEVGAETVVHATVFDGERSAANGMRVVDQSDRTRCTIPDRLDELQCCSTPSSRCCRLGGGACLFGEVAAASVGEELLLAVSDTSGCGAGRLLVGTQMAAVAANGDARQWQWERPLEGLGPCPAACPGAAQVSLTLARDSAAGALVTWRSSGQTGSYPLMAAHIDITPDGPNVSEPASWAPTADLQCGGAGGRATERTPDYAVLSLLSGDAASHYVVASVGERTCCRGIALTCVGVRASTPPTLRPCGCVPAESARHPQLAPSHAGGGLLVWASGRRIHAAVVLPNGGGEKDSSCESPRFQSVPLASTATLLSRPTVTPLGFGEQTARSEGQWLVSWLAWCDGGDVCLHGLVVAAGRVCDAPDAQDRRASLCVVSGPFESHRFESEASWVAMLEADKPLALDVFALPESSLRVAANIGHPEGMTYGTLDCSD